MNKTYFVRYNLEQGRCRPFKKGQFAWLPDVIALIVGVSVLIFGIVH